MIRLKYCHLDGAEHPPGIRSKTCKKCNRFRARKFRATEYGRITSKKYTEFQKTQLAYLARQKVFAEVKARRFPKVKTLRCVDCGDQAQCYDHREYAKPLKVEPVCRRCNIKRGPAIDAHLKI